MYVTKRNDKYRAWERIVLPDGSVKKISVTMDRDTPQARRKAGELLKYKASTFMPSENLTFKELCDLYIADQAVRCKRSTMRMHKIELNHFCTQLGYVRVDRLTSGKLRTAMLALTSNPRTLNEYRTRLKALIRWAYQNDYIGSTACVDKIAAWDVKKDKHELKYLEKEELREVIAASNPLEGALIEFMALSGLRVGEMVALTNADVTDTEINVNKTYDAINHLVTTAKTDTSVRKVYVQPELLKTIKKIRKLSDMHRIRTGSRSDLFVVNKHGERLSTRMFQLYVGKVTEQITGRHLTPHALRHTHTSLLAEAGVPLETISRRLGHNGSQVTKDVYLHVTKKVS